MAVIGTDTRNAAPATTTGGSFRKRLDRQGREIPEAKPVDLNASGLKTGKKSKLDPTEDAWATSAPPPKGEYTLKVFLAKDGMKMGLIDPSDADSVYYEAELECNIKHDNPEFDNCTAFSRVSTKIGRGKNISTMAGLINKMGYKLPDEATPLQLAKMLKAAIAKEPVLYNNGLDWSGWSNNDQKVICASMDDFPQDEEGNPIHEFTITNRDGGREKIKASLKIRVWGSKKATAVAGVAGAKGKQVVEDTEEVEEAQVAQATKPISAAKVNGKATGAAGAKVKVKTKPPEPELEPEIEEEEIEEVEGGNTEEEEELALDEE